MADLVAVGEQSRAILRRHPWLPALVMTRPVIGPNGIAVLEHVLTVLACHPADLQAKMEAFAMLNGLTAALCPVRAQRRLGACRIATSPISSTRSRQASTPGSTALLSQAPQPAPHEPPDPADRFADMLARILTGLLGHHA